MWNLAKVNDIWYEFDFTWDDNGTTDYDYNYFALSEDDFSLDHVIDGQTLGIDYLYPLPDISDKSMDLVKLHNDDNYLGYFESIDKALEVTTEDKDYQIELINSFARETTSSINKRVYSLKNTEKKFNSLTINGMKNITIIEDGEVKYYLPTEIDIIEDLNLENNITFENVILSSKANKYLKVNNSTLTLKGIVTINAEIKSDNGTIINNPSYKVDYNNKVTIKNMNFIGKGTYINSDAEIDTLTLSKSNYPIINFKTDDTIVSITNIIYKDATTTDQAILPINANAKNNKLEISNITKDESSKYDYFLFNLNISDVENNPEVSFKEDISVKINYLIVSSTLTRTDFVSKKIVKTTTENKKKFNLYFGSTSVYSGALSLDEDGYIILKS